MKEKEQAKKRKKIHKKVHRRHRPRIPVQLAVVLMVLLVCIGGTFAWYTWLERAAGSKDAEVMEPYYLYLRDKSDTEMVRLALDQTKKAAPSEKWGEETSTTPWSWCTPRMSP